MNIEAFIDLENLGITFGVPYSKTKLGFIASTLPGALAKEGFELASASCFASDGRPTMKLPHMIKHAMREAVESCHWRMVWSHNIADRAIISAVEDRLTKGTLTQAALFVTNDHHFAPIMRRVKATGRTVINCTTDCSERLKAVADRSFELWKLLGENPGEICWQRLEAHRTQTPALNPLAFPDSIRLGDDDSS